MKFLRLIKASALAAGITAGLAAQDVKFDAPAGQQPPATPSPAAPATPAAPAEKFTETQLLETFGWFIGKRVGLAELGFTDAQVESMIKGLKQAAGGGEAPYKLEEIGPEMDKFMQAKQGQYVEKLRQQGMAESTKFLAEIKAKPGVVTLPSGLAYEIVKPGEGEYPKATDTVKVHYTGTLVNGTVFDSSVQRGEPMEIALNQVIPGWTEGMQKINKGGKIKLYVPPQLGYGDNGQGGIPPAATLIFDVELLEIKAATPAATPAPAPAPVGK
ncbi:MAG TPA: FKBP-type peptidyl-prolyl cis-trans isomerase [Opitutaceae bacterium]